MPVRNQRSLEPRIKLDPAVVELYRRSRAEEFGIPANEFAAMVDEVATKSIPESTKSQMQDFFKRLHVEGLALARACAAGNERAWQVFMLRFREKLYDAGRQIARDEPASNADHSRWLGNQSRRPPSGEGKWRCYFAGAHALS